MTVKKKTEIVFECAFDPRTSRHTINGETSVLHCHHYATLYSQLADDCGMLDGKQLLAEVAEDTFLKILSDYYKVNGLSCPKERIQIAEQYYAATGLGKLKVCFMGPDSGEVELPFSHVDQGWIKKFGRRDKPVNFITSGYIAALFSAVNGKPARSYQVIESQSIVTGAECSRFLVVVR